MAEAVEIRILSPYQNLKIVQDAEAWKGIFLPPNTDASETKSSLKKYSLDPDRVNALLEVFLNRPENASSQDSNEVQLSIKTKSQEKHWYISSIDPLRRIVLLPSTEWRSKKIFNQDSSRVEQITLQTVKPAVTLIREGDKWLWLEKPQKALQQEWIESLARKISRLKAQTLNEKPTQSEAGFDPPRAELTVKFRGDPSLFRVLLGKQKSQNLFYVEVEGLPAWKDEIFTVNEESAEKFLGGITQFSVEAEK